MKTIINFDSTALGNATCERALYLTTIGSINPETNQSEGGYKTLMPASAIYGVGLHKYIDTMYKTKGNIPLAKDAALKSFNKPKLPALNKQKWLDDSKHFLSVCYNVWEEYCLKETNFQLLEIPIKCWNCDGASICSICNGTGIIQGPSTELTFRILFYEDEFVQVYLNGTIDRLGKFSQGIFAIRDWKSTSSWDKDKYLESYKLSRQLRVYCLAIKLMAEKEPNSTLGKIGNTNIGGVIDGIFLSAKPNEVTVQSSQVFQFSKLDILQFKNNLSILCMNLSCVIQEETRGDKQGILNGACTTIFGRCKFFNVCANDGPVGDMILKQQFTRKMYDPLKFNED